MNLARKEVFILVIFDIDGKKVLKVSLQMELDLLDKKIARVISARNELHQAICDLFNKDTSQVEGWTVQDPAIVKAVPAQPAVSE